MIIEFKNLDTSVKTATLKLEHANGKEMEGKPLKELYALSVLLGGFNPMRTFMPFTFERSADAWVKFENLKAKMSDLIEETRELMFEESAPDPMDLTTYDVLECPHCDKLCKPDAIGKDGTCIYELHRCKPEFALYAMPFRFEINREGELVE